MSDGSNEPLKALTLYSSHLWAVANQTMAEERYEDRQAFVRSALARDWPRARETYDEAQERIEGQIEALKARWPGVDYRSRTERQEASL